MFGFFDFKIYYVTSITVGVLIPLIHIRPLLLDCIEETS